MVALNKCTKPKEGRDGNARPNDLMEVMVMMSVPTKFGPNPADNDGINLQQMEAQDVKCLRRQDPFMFYSIPGVHKAAVLSKDVDYSDITALAQADNDGQPSSNRQEDKEVKVSRSTRISFECHPSVLLENLLLENATQDFGQDVLSMIGDDDDFDYLDDIVSMIKKPSSKQ